MPLNRGIFLYSSKVGESVDRGSWFVTRGSENPWIVDRDSGIEKSADRGSWIGVRKIKKNL